MKHTRIIYGSGLALALTMLACTAGATGGATLTSRPGTSAPVEMTATTAPDQLATASGVIAPTTSPSAASFEDACGKGAATLPATAPKFADYAATILNTLSAHTSVEAIDRGLRAWGSVTDRAGALDATHDLTGDGVADLLVVAQAPQDQFPDFVSGPPGDLYIYGCPDGDASLLFGDYSTPDRATPRLIAVADINGNHLDEVAYTTRICGAHTCFVQMHVVEWDVASQKFEATFPQDTAAPSGEHEIIDVDGDGVSEIVQHVGGISSVGAGAQRTFDETYAWDGAQYALKTRVVTSPQFPIHYLNDADDATRTGDYARAIGLYRQVIDDPAPLIFQTPAEDEIPALKAYARYRLMLAYVLSGDEANARAVYDELSSQFANTPAEASGASFAHFAGLFWNAYQSGHDLKAGCAPVIALAASDDATYRILNDYGYANTLYKPEDLCPSG